MEDSGRGKVGSRKAGVLDERGEPLGGRGNGKSGIRGSGGP
jgi:hypothetical protein